VEKFTLFALGTEENASHEVPANKKRARAAAAVEKKDRIISIDFFGSLVKQPVWGVLLCL